MTPNAFPQGERSVAAPSRGAQMNSAFKIVLATAAACPKGASFFVAPDITSS
jgi:hypothetical protein